jgi:hypothetical protein
MDSMNYAVPDSLKDFVLTRLNDGGFNTVDEYVSNLIRADRLQADSHQLTRAQLEAEVLKGIRSPKAPMTDQDWADIRSEIHRRAASRRSASP